MEEKIIEEFEKEFGAVQMLPIHAKVNIRTWFVKKLNEALSQSKKDVIEEIEKKWEERIIEAKQALYNEYGVNHKYTPHYEAILDDILLSLKDKEE